MFGRFLRSTLGNVSTQLGFLDSLQRWLATIVYLNISSRLTMGEKLQYLRDGFLRQLFIIVVLKSGGWCKFLRSSSTVAQNVMGNDDRIIMGRKRMVVADMVAMNEFILRKLDFGITSPHSSDLQLAKESRFKCVGALVWR